MKTFYALVVCLLWSGDCDPFGDRQRHNEINAEQYAKTLHPSWQNIHVTCQWEDNRKCAVSADGQSPEFLRCDSHGCAPYGTSPY